MEKAAETLFKSSIISAITMEAEMGKLLKEANKIIAFLTEEYINPKNSLRMKFFNDAVVDLKEVIKQHPNWVNFCMESTYSDKQKLATRLKKILYRFETFFHFITSQMGTAFPLIIKSATRKISALITILAFKKPPNNKIRKMVERVFEDDGFGFSDSYAMRFRFSRNICLTEAVFNVERSDEDVKTCRTYDFVGENCNPERICRKVIRSDLDFELSTSLLEAYIHHSLHKLQFILFLFGFNDDSFIEFLSLVRILPLAAKGSKIVLVTHARDTFRLFGEVIPIFQNHVTSEDKKRVSEMIGDLITIKNPLQNLVNITLYGCSKCQVFYVNHLPHLRALYVNRCESLTSLLRNEGEESRGCVKILSVTNCINMESISLVLLAYPENLSLLNCPKLLKIVPSTDSISKKSGFYASIKHLIINNCPILASIAYGGRDLDGENNIAQTGKQEKAQSTNTCKLDEEGEPIGTEDVNIELAEIASKPPSPHLSTVHHIGRLRESFPSGEEEEWSDFHGFRVTPRLHPYLEEVHSKERDFWSSCIDRGRVSINIHLNVLGEALAKMDTTWEALTPRDLSFIINAIEDSLAAGFRVDFLQQYLKRARIALNQKTNAKRESILMELSAMFDEIHGLTKVLANLGAENPQIEELVLNATI